MSLIDIAIVNYNTREYLRTCLNSIFAEKSSDCVIVVDNASADGSAAMVKETCPAVVLIENVDNKGFGAAANQAIRLSTAKYVLLLNSDTELMPGSVARLVDYLEHNPRVAIAGPRLVNTDGSLQKSTYPMPIPVDLFFDASNLPHLMSKIPLLRELSLRTWAHNRTRAVPWLTGAAMAIRRLAFDQVGGFDETFYVYYEETDLCFRLAKRGWEVHFLPSSQVAHVGGASTHQQMSDTIVQFYSSLAHFYRVHYSRARMAQLVRLVKLIALGRLMRDHLYVVFGKKKSHRQNLDKKIKAWRRLLITSWEKDQPFG